MSTEAMKLALEALEVATTPLAKDRQEVLRAITALREALAEQPAQRTWVGLTDKEIDDLSREMVKGNKSVNWLSYSIEAKLRERNT